MKVIVRMVDGSVATYNTSGLTLDTVFEFVRSEIKTAKTILVRVK